MTSTKQRLTIRHFFFDLFKGFLIGSGFIVPGVSGGALAAIFGIYEPIIDWLAHIFDRFWQRLIYFFPIGLGMVLGLVVFSALVELALDSYQTIVQWGFIGTIIGMFPSLWKEAGRKGRSRSDITLMILVFIMVSLSMLTGERFLQGSMDPHFLSWLMCGVLIALGGLIPGLSPSNFILFMGLYQDMANGFRTLDISVIIPIALGGILTVLFLSRLIKGWLNHYYRQFYHIILGTVLASTFMIIPTDYEGIGIIGYILCFLALTVGGWLGAWMCQLEDKYKSKEVRSN